MQDLIFLASSFLGGLFLGYLAAVLSFFVAQLIREGLSKPKEFALPALALLAIFGTGLFYVGVVVLRNLPLFIGAAVSFLWASKPLFRPEE